tara:strand:- start:415 stop:714 length:300 start_codon:yes stop_codon:yes gene_type:complete
MTVRKHILENLETLFFGLPSNKFRTSDIQELAYEGKKEFGKFLGSPGTYTREFRRMRTDGIIKVKKLNKVNRQQIWELEKIGNKENDVEEPLDYSSVPF